LKRNWGKEIAYVTGLLVIDAPASALNKAGPDTGAKTDNTIAVKKIRVPSGGELPYVSAQAVRYWIRMTLQNAGGKWIAAPIYREGKVAYTAADPSITGTTIFSVTCAHHPRKLTLLKTRLLRLSKKIAI
jgi:hypothetical protein